MYFHIVHYLSSNCIEAKTDCLRNNFSHNISHVDSSHIFLKPLDSISPVLLVSFSEHHTGLLSQKFSNQIGDEGCRSPKDDITEIALPQRKEPLILDDPPKAVEDA